MDRLARDTSQEAVNKARDGSRRPQTRPCVCAGTAAGDVPDLSLHLYDLPVLTGPLCPQHGQG